MSILLHIFFANEGRKTVENLFFYRKTDANIDLYGVDKSTNKEFYSSVFSADCRDSWLWISAIPGIAAIPSIPGKEKFKHLCLNFSSDFSILFLNFYNTTQATLYVNGTIEFRRTDETEFLGKK